MSGRQDNKNTIVRFQVSEDDIFEAMKDISGYLDITPGDLKEIYFHAYQHALDRIENAVKASDLMTREVLAVYEDTPLGEVAEIMAANGISGIPVIDSEKHVLGILSEKDFCLDMGNSRLASLMEIIADCINNRGCAAMTIRGKRAADLMSTPAIVADEETSLAEIKALMAENNINRVPVIDRNRRLTGMVSRADIVRILFEKSENES